ncbi:MAG: hypothetical protein AAB597_00870 [Patescibacteria group bacterium]
MGIHWDQRLIRAIFALLLFFFALLAPLYISAGLAVLFVIFYRHPLEVFFAALIRDLLFGAPVVAYGDSGYITTAISITLILLAYALRSFLRGRNFRILGA